MELNNVFKMEDYRDKLNLFILIPGDFVEWRDYTGELIISEIASFSKYDFDVFPPNRLPISQRHQYKFEFSAGLTVLGSCITRKVLTKDVKLLRRRNI